MPGLLRRALAPTAAAGPPPRAPSQPGRAALDTGTLTAGAPTNVVTAVVIIHFIARRLGALPRVVHERDDRTRRPVRRPEHRCLWGRPNPDEHAVPFWTRVFAHLEGWGECFLWRRTDPAGRTVALDAIHPSAVTVDAAADGARTYTLTADPDRRYTPDDIIHVMAVTWDGRRGVPPVQAGLGAHQTANLQERWQRGFLRRGSSPSGVVSSPADLDDDAVVEFYDAWTERHGGPEGVGNIILLQGGATFNPVTIPPAEAQLLQARNYSREEVLGLYAPGLPHHLLGWKSNTSNFGTGIEAQNTHLVQHVFQPRLDLMSDVLSAALLPDGLVLDWETDQWLRGDARTQAEVRAKDRLGGFLTRDEGRRQMAMPALAGPDDVWTPSNVIAAPARTAE